MNICRVRMLGSLTLVVFLSLQCTGQEVFKMQIIIQFLPYILLTLNHLYISIDSYRLHLIWYHTIISYDVFDLIKSCHIMHLIWCMSHDDLILLSDVWHILLAWQLKDDLPKWFSTRTSYTYTTNNDTRCDFLAVQDSWIGNLVTDSMINQLTFDFLVSRTM